MRVLAVTKIFPNAVEPLSAPFNRQQLVALGRRCDVEVLATIPWFPGAGAFSRWSSAAKLGAVPRHDWIDGLAVAHPRVPYLPRFGHALSGALYAASVLPDLLQRRGQFDVILGTWAYPDGAAVAALGQLLRIPTVVKLHGSDMDILAQRPSLRRQMQLTLPRAGRVVAVSRSLAAAARELGVPDDRIDVIGNGVDSELFHPRDRAAARAALGHGGDTRKWILFVGRLEVDKGVPDLAIAFQQVAAARPDAVLVLIGDGKARAAADEALKPLGDRVLFLGARPLAEVPVWMGACDILTLPSHHEGTPNVLLEALACGRRVVATRVGGIPDVVHHDELGALVPVSDPGALTQALLTALATDYDGDAVAALGSRGGWDESAGRLYDTLARAIAGAKDAGAHNGTTHNGAPMNGTSNGTSNREADGDYQRSALPPPPRMAAPAVTPTLASRMKVRVAEALPRSVIVRRGSGKQKLVALTFDDGPDEMTEAYLDILDKFGAHATFFVLGKACARYQDAVAHIAARGHELAGHGFTHKSFTKMDPDALRDELARTSAFLPAASTARPLVRPPHGATSVRSLMVTARAGYTTVLWSRDSDDCRTSNPVEVAARVAPAGLTPGEIVLLHEGQSWTLDALPTILGNLAAEGWRAVSVGEMLGSA